MPANPLPAKIAALLQETAHAHHQAFLQTDGLDPEWPLWYAQHLQEKLSTLLNHPLTISELVFHIIRLDKVYTTKARRQPWQEFYGQKLISEYSS